MAVMYRIWVTEEAIPLLFDELRIFYLGPVTLAQDFTVFNMIPDSIVVKQAFVDDTPGLLFQEEFLCRKSDESPVLPEWLQKQVIGVEDVIKEILEK